MKIAELFPSNFLKADDIPSPRGFTIKAVGVEEVGPEKTRKPVLFLNEEKRGLVLNKTNSSIIAHVFGQETDLWIGKPVELYKEAVQFQGRVVDAIRVRMAPPQAVETAADSDIDW